MAASDVNQQLALVVSSNTTTSYEELLESQKALISKQICDLQTIVSKQCQLTGVNPLSQEMVRVNSLIVIIRRYICSYSKLGLQVD